VSAPTHAQAHVGNRPPSLEGVSLDPTDAVKVGQPVVAVPTARDPDGDAIHFRYEWRVNGQPAHEDHERFSTAGLHRGDRIQARVVASDGEAESPPFDSPAVSVANSPPQITSNPQQVQIQDGTYHYAVEARDPDGDSNLRYKLVKGPQGARIDPVMGEFTWQPTREQVGTHAVEVSVDDGHGGETHQTFELTVREALAKAGDDATAEPQPRRYNGRARAAAAAKAVEEQEQAAPQLQPPAAAQE
jgi:Bacterial Ig domain